MADTLGIAKELTLAAIEKGHIQAHRSNHSVESVKQGNADYAAELSKFFRDIHKTVVDTYHNS